MALAWPAKDPDEVLDYQIDWASRLAEGDTIDTSTWEIASGDGELTIDSDTNGANSATVWLSGGTLGRTYELTNRVETAGGRTHEQTMTLQVAAK